MILRIVPSIDDEIVVKAGSNVKLMDYLSFNDISSHPFIATNVWEYVEVVLDDKIRQGYIKQLLTKDNIVIPILKKDATISNKMLLLLIECVPFKKRELRTAFYKKQDIISVLEKEGVKFEVY